ncbi:hypothetical protein BH11ACT5_BH11ACT5_23190 [soil metagenome]
MALTVKQLVNRHGAFVSAVTALIVGVALIVLRFLEFLIGLVVTLGQGQLYGFPFLQVMLLAIPFAAGYFVSLWIIAPIAEELRLPHVITRAILATGVASTVVFIVFAITNVIGAVSFDGYIFGQSFPTVRFDSIPNALGNALLTGVSIFVSTLPLGVLAGVLLWIWRKDHPPRHPLSGLIDEV